MAVLNQVIVLLAIASCVAVCDASTGSISLDGDMLHLSWQDFSAHEGTVTITATLKQNAWYF